MLCQNCGAQLPDSTKFCPECGHKQQAAQMPLQQNQPHQLPVGTLLRGRYQVGRALGQGGFGITYLGYDTLMEVSVAIKEFYPSATVNRNCGQTLYVQCHTNQMNPHFQASKARFLREAKALVQFKNIPEIVDILDFVEENNTAYIVMEYVQGMNLANYVASKGGRLAVDEAFRILRPVMEALAAVHKGGIVHRDISPDNVMLHPMGGAKLLDFGAVRAMESADADAQLARSTEAILKHGFAPIEQYNSRGGLGPWTDEYAMCATVYYCLTGRIPEEASVRISEGVNPDWSGIPGLTDNQRRALERGMALRAKDRYPTMDELIADLFAPEVHRVEPVVQAPAAVVKPAEPVQPQQSAPKAPQTAVKKRKGLAPLLIIALIVLAGLGIGAAVLFGGSGQEAAPVQTEQLPEAYLWDMYEIPEMSMMGIFQADNGGDGMTQSPAIMMDVWNELGMSRLREVTPVSTDPIWDRIAVMPDAYVYFYSQDMSSYFALHTSRDGKILVEYPMGTVRYFEDSAASSPSSVYEKLGNATPDFGVMSMASLLPQNAGSQAMIETLDWTVEGQPAHEAYDLRDARTVSMMVASLSELEIGRGTQNDIPLEHEIILNLKGEAGEWVIFRITNDGWLQVDIDEWTYRFPGEIELYELLLEFLPA